MAELLKIFDANREPIAPFEADRKEIHEKGLWHETFHCWILRRDTENKIVFQFRAARKEDGASSLDISAAGHLNSKETPEDGVREIEEEVGIKVDFTKLVPLGIWKQSSLRPGYINNEFCHSYFLETDKLIDDYKMQIEELDGLFELNISDGFRLFSGETDEVEMYGRIKDGEIYKSTKMKFKLEDFYGFHERCKLTPYYLRVIIMADRYFKGEKYLTI